MSALEGKFSLYWRGLNGPKLEKEFRFHPERKWRFDFAHPATKTAIEVEGGIFSGGRHTRGKGYSADCEKYNEATLLGWRIFRLTGAQIKAPLLEKIISAINTNTKHPMIKHIPVTREIEVCDNCEKDVSGERSATRIEFEATHPIGMSLHVAINVTSQSKSGKILCATCSARFIAEKIIENHTR